MSVVSAIRRMIEAGLSTEQALLAAETCEREFAPARSNAAERAARYRARETSGSGTERDDVTSVTNVTNVTRDERDERDDEKKAPSHSPKENQESQKKTPLRGSKEKGGELDEALEAYNATAERLGLAKARGLTADRRPKLRSRLAEIGGLPGFQRALEALGRAPSLLGEAQSGYRADLDFLLKPGKLNRLIEGGYDFRPGTGPPQPEDPIKRALNGLREKPQNGTGSDFDGPTLDLMAQRGDGS